MIFSLSLDCQKIDNLAQRAFLPLLKGQQFCGETQFKDSYLLFYRLDNANVEIHEEGVDEVFYINQTYKKPYYKFQNPGYAVFTATENTNLYLSDGFLGEIEPSCDRVYFSNMKQGNLSISPRNQDKEYHASDENICAVFTGMTNIKYEVTMKNVDNGDYMIVTTDYDISKGTEEQVTLDSDIKKVYVSDETAGINTEFLFFLIHAQKNSQTEFEITTSGNDLAPTYAFQGFIDMTKRFPSSATVTPEKSSLTTTIVCIFVLLAIVGAGVGGYMFYTRKNEKPKYIPVQDVEYEIHDVTDKI